MAGEAVTNAAEKNKPHSLHPKYRPDIDGLRAIAVGSVLVFHAFPEWIASGFIGVDIFFVISGFLISLILFNNLEQGRFSILDFYVRRVRRIFPALMTVMLSCIVAGWFVLFADEYKQLGKHLFGGSTFISNVLFWRESGYFDNAAETKPLLHLWSLAIEEQFYLFWPLLLAFVWKRKWGFLRIVAVIALASFLINIYLVSRDQTAAFYSPFARFWELMVGGVLGYINLHRPDLNSRYRNLQSSLGLLLLAVGFALLSSASAFPGWWALLPSVGAFLLLSAGPEAWFNRHVLSNRLMVWIGLISYPLYLWHWPLLAFATIIEGEKPAPHVRFGAVVLSVLMAWLTFVLIERPLRKSHSLRVVWTLFALNVLVAACGMLIYLNDGFNGREINKQLDYLSAADIFEGSRNSDGSCNRLNHLPGVAEEVCLSNSAQPTTMFVGDSHVMALHSSIFSKDIQASAIMVAGHACHLYPNLTYTPTYLRRWANNCTAIANEAIKVAAETPSVQTVVLGGAYPRDDLSLRSQYYLDGKQLSSRDAFLSGNGAMIDSLLKLGKKVVFVVDVPYLKLDPHSCVNRFNPGTSRECGYSMAEHEALRKDYDAAVIELKKQHPGVTVFDPTPLFCHDGMCTAKRDNVYLYNDTQHISLPASKYLLSTMQERGLLQLDGVAPKGSK